MQNLQDNRSYQGYLYIYQQLSEVLQGGQCIRRSEVLILGEVPSLQHTYVHHPRCTAPVIPGGGKVLCPLVQQCNK